LIWNDSDRWTVRLDQGFGYWGAAPRIRPEFPFDREPARQIAKLQQASLIIEPLNPDHPTHWYCGRRD
jgi:DEAD/DEAH box helicase domain-containing protein